MKSCKRWYEEKKCYWKCCLWLCNSHRQHIKAHPTSWHYPLITYLVCSSAIVMLSQSSLELRSLLDPLESGVALKVNIFQNHLFLYQITHNMTKDCSLNYQFSIQKLQAQNMLCTKLIFVLTFRTIFAHNMFWQCSELGRYWTGKSIDNLLKRNYLYTPTSTSYIYR